MVRSFYYSNFDVIYRWINPDSLFSFRMKLAIVICLDSHLRGLIEISYRAKVFIYEYAMLIASIVLFSYKLFFQTCNVDRASSSQVLSR